MRHFRRRCKEFLREEDGVTSVEYAVVLAMILMAIVSAIGSVGGESGKWWDSIEADLECVGFIK